eukprot:1005400_1
MINQHPRLHRKGPSPRGSWTMMISSPTLKRNFHSHWVVISAATKSQRAKIPLTTMTFFASLQQEMGKALSDETPTPEKVDEALQDDFFSSLIDDMADELESSPAPEVTSSSSSSSSKPKASSGNNHGDDLSSLKVPELKEMLKSRGLKVGGKSRID